MATPDEQRPWHLKRLAVFDLETTSADYETARVVTACVAGIGDRWAPTVRTWMADPGVEIPAEATAVHGITTQRAREEGRPAPVVVEEITAALHDAMSLRVPVVAMNARFDFTVLDREARRWGIVPLVDRVGGPDGLLVLDPLVIDKKMDRYRPGSRKLIDLCALYGVEHGGEHDATADAIAAGEVVQAQARRYHPMQRLSVIGMHAHQVHWAREQAESFAAYLARQGKPEPVQGAWPVVPVTEGGAA